MILANSNNISVYGNTQSLDQLLISTHGFIGIETGHRNFYVSNHGSNTAPFETPEKAAPTISHINNFLMNDTGCVSCTIFLHATVDGEEVLVSSSTDEDLYLGLNVGAEYTSSKTIEITNSNMSAFTAKLNTNRNRLYPTTPHVTGFNLHHVHIVTSIDENGLSNGIVAFGDTGDMDIIITRCFMDFRNAITYNPIILSQLDWNSFEVSHNIILVGGHQAPLLSYVDPGSSSLHGHSIHNNTFISYGSLIGSPIITLGGGNDIANNRSNIIDNITILANNSQYLGTPIITFGDTVGLREDYNLYEIPVGSISVGASTRVYPGPNTILDNALLRDIPDQFEFVSYFDERFIPSRLSPARGSSSTGGERGAMDYIAIDDNYGHAIFNFVESTLNIPVEFPNGSFNHVTNNSDINTRLPSYIDPNSYTSDIFDTSVVASLQGGSGDYYGYNTDIDGRMRTGIGALSFNALVFEPEYELIKCDTDTVVSDKRSFSYRYFWDTISTIWNFKSLQLQNWFEKLWNAINEVFHKMVILASVTASAQNPDGDLDDIVDYQFSVNVGPLHSLPILLNPVDSMSGNSYISTDGVFLNSSVINEDTGDVDASYMVTIGEKEFESLYDVIDSSMFIVIQSPSLDKTTAYRVNAILSSEYNGDKLNRRKDNQPVYAIEILDDMSEYVNSYFSFYITTAREYKLEPGINSIEGLTYNPIDSAANDFNQDADYHVRDSVIEFFNPINNNNTLYSEYVEYVDRSVYESRGNMVDMVSPDDYNFDNAHGRTHISAATRGLYNSDKVSGLNLALNAVYGTPIAIDDGEVVGLFESYEYKVSGVNQWSISINGLTVNSQLFQSGAWVYCIESHRLYRIDSVDYDNSIVNILPPSGTQDLRDEISAGNTVYIKLRNRYSVLRYTTEIGESDPASIVVFNNEDTRAFSLALNHSLRLGVLPEIIVSQSAYSGVYHISSVANAYEHACAELRLYRNMGDAADISVGYNDFIENSVYDDTGAMMHMPWPTHKFLLIHHGECNYTKYYMDSNVDTALETGDKVKKYDVLSRTVSSIEAGLIKGWSSLDQFQMYNKHDERNGILHIVSSIHGAEAGNYIRD